MIRRRMLWSVALLAGAAGAFASWPRARHDLPTVALAPAPPQARSAQRAPTPTSPRALPREAATAPPRPHVDPVPERSNDEVAMRQAESYDGLIERQAADPARREEIRGRAQDAFAQAESDGIWLGATQCGETLCRVEVQLEDADARRAFDHIISKIPAGMGEAFVYLEDEDDLDLEVYVSPDDRPLP